MTEKLYGLDDIPEGWVLEEITLLYMRYKAELFEDNEEGRLVVAVENTPQLALHKAIQKAKGEV